MMLATSAQAECQLSLSHPTLNYGKVHDKDYTSQYKRWKTLNDREVQLTAICDTAEKMAIFVQGGEQDDGFRFATDSIVLVEAANATLDGHSVMLGKTTSHAPFALNGQGSNKMVLRDNDGLLPLSGNRILEGKQFSVTLTVRPALSDRDTTAVHDRTTLESNLHFTVETQ
ncbi:TPA: hypothetical protein U2I12_004148 [Citrobacter farmeri]|nr:hypothetical protein [Citrobacter farmeri]